MSDPAIKPAAGGRGSARSRARRLAMQALYQWQITGAEGKDVLAQFREHEDYGRVDAEFFGELVRAVTEHADELDEEIGEFSDRTTAQLDPVEHAILLLGVYELKHRVDVPYRVVINEAVELCRTFGAEDGHRFVNALLDGASRKHRAVEHEAGA